MLTDVRDVPNDNGGFVFLTWTASSYAEELSPEYRDRFEEAQRTASQTRVDSRSLRGRAVREGRTIAYVNHDWSIPIEYPDFRSASVFGPCAVVFAPLMIQGRCIGILSVMRTP